MSNLPEVIYNIVLDPNALIDFAQNSQALMAKFNLSSNEIDALKSVLADHNSLQHFLSAETVKQATQGLLEKAWVPPSLS